MNYLTETIKDYKAMKLELFYVIQMANSWNVKQKPRLPLLLPPAVPSTVGVVVSSPLVR